MKLDKIGQLTPTEYSKYSFINEMVSSLGGAVKSACDIGCGVGNLLFALEGHDIKFTGIETSPESLAIAREKGKDSGITFLQKDASEVSEKYDIVFLTDVLEHIKDDASFLNLIRDRIISDKGYFIMTVPSHSRMFSQFDKDAGHYRRYDNKNVIKLLSDNGFEVISCRSYGLILFHFAANMMLAIDRKKKKSDSSMDDKTRLSSVREYSGITKSLVSRVNALHHICLFLDKFVLRNANVSLEYCILAKRKK